MLKIQVTTAEAVIQETELITAGRRGLVCSFAFDSAWDSLAKTVVISGVVKRDVMLVGDSIVIPGECIAKENYPLKIGVYGANPEGDVVIPTVWASFGKIYPSAQRSEIPPDEVTPDLVSQIEQNSANAIYLAQQVSQMAASGAFDGTDGEDGAPGPAGQDGAPGVGVPTGGTTGQVLKKASGTDYDTVWANESGGGGGAVESVNGQTGAVVLDASDVGALPDDTTYVSSVNGSTGAVIVSVPSASSAAPKALGTASAGSSADFSRADHVHDKPSYSKSDVGLGNVDNVQQYSANNPPPYPVTSVNSQTGAVSLSIPATAGDVGAIPAPASPSAGDVLTYSGSAWAAAAPAHQIPAGGNAGECLAKNSSSNYDLRWRTINDWTPAGLMRTAGGTAAKVAEWSFWSATQYPAWLVVTVGNSNTYAGAITLKVNGSTAYPIYINGAASSATNYTLPAGSYFVYFDGSKFDFRTDGKLPGDIIGHAGKDIQAPASPTTGDFLVWNGSAWAAMSLSTWQGGNY